jgi:hypothetical protein
MPNRFLVKEAEKIARKLKNLQLSPTKIPNLVLLY